jgi:3-dehydroquinate dehydratase / shikimate dehydrogenase
MTLLCVPITVHSLETAWGEAVRALEAGADVVEYRVDSFTELDAVRELVDRSPARCVVTCRAAYEGGLCELPDQERIPVLEAASIAGADYIDVEWASYSKSANLRQKVHFNAGAAVDRTAPRPNRKGLIVSAHDFAGRPARLTALAGEITESGADVVKLAWMARSVRDNLEAFDLLRHRGKPTIALCMGEAGLMSRVLAPKFGGFLTFASLADTSATAPGQPTIRELLELYRFRSISPATAVYGVVGHPVSHSLSPHVHNRHFELRGDDAVYLPMPVSPSYEAFKAFMESLGRDEHLTLRGLSVTLPHKENAFRYLTEIGAEIAEVARSTGAVNTIALDAAGGGGGRVRGTSTDHAAILYAVGLGLGGRSLAGRTVAVLGAGGTGRTAVAALAGAGATVVIHNRTLERAMALAREFDGVNGAKVVAAEFALLPRSCAQVFINTTSLGMRPNVEDSPWGRDGELMPTLGPEAVVFDTVYTPMDTRFLIQTRERQAVTVAGVEMFAHQAASQYRFWTGREAEPAPFRERAIEVLRERGVA